MQAICGRKWKKMFASNSFVNQIH